MGRGYSEQIDVIYIIIYKEKANKWKLISLGFAIVGLMVMIIGYKELPIIAIGLASTFAIYTAIKKVWIYRLFSPYSMKLYFHAEKQTCPSLMTSLFQF